VMEGHLYRLPEPPRALNPAVSVAMQEVVLRALAKHPDDRYQRAGDLGAALLSALVAGDVEPLPFGVGGPSSPMSLPIVTPEPARSAPMRSGATAADWNPPQLDPAGRPLVPMSGAWTSTARPDGRTGGSVTGGPPPGMPLGGLPGGGTGMSGVGMSGTTGALARNRLTQGAASAGTGVGAVGAPLASNGGALSPAFPLAPGVFPMAGRTSGPAPMSQPLPPLPPLDGPAPAAQQEPSRQAAMGQPAPASVPLPPMGTRGAGASLEYRPSRANALWPWLVVVVVLAVVAVVLLVMASHGHEAGWEAAPEALRAMVAGGRGRA